jgi:hypothetical protein
LNNLQVLDKNNKLGHLLRFFFFSKGRLQRCAMDCGDKVRDRQDLDKIQQRTEVESCIKTCSDEIIKLLPAFSKRMNDWFKSKSYLK